MKNRVKQSGCRWDANAKCWVASELVMRVHPYLEKYRQEPTKVYYAVPFKLKDQFKLLGGRFDFERKCWYVMSTQTTGDLSEFEYLRIPGDDSIFSPVVRIDS
jgi:hypothetical protein